MNNYDELDLSLIKQSVSNNASFEMSRDYILNEEVSFNPIVIRDNLRKTKEAMKIISLHGRFEFTELKDISTGYVKSGYRKLIGCDGGGVPIYTLTGYHVVQGVAPSVGDIIEINDNGTIRLMKVKDIKGPKIFGLVQTPNVSS